MRHARSDYDHIQDLARIDELTKAYFIAMQVQSELPTMEPTTKNLQRVSRTLSALLLQLYPLIDGGPTLMRSIIPADEPVFLLRAKDQIAPPIVRAYAKMHHGDERFVRACVAQADRMEDYAREHYNGGKEADAPHEALRV
jgi:hypothetical protein